MGKKEMEFAPTTTPPALRDALRRWRRKAPQGEAAAGRKNQGLILRSDAQHRVAKDACGRFVSIAGSGTPATPLQSPP